MSFRAAAIHCTAVVVVLLLAGSGCWGQQDRRVQHNLTDAALLCSYAWQARKPCGPKPKYTKVPYFPGVTFGHSDCSRMFTFDRFITVDANQLTFYTQAGPINDRPFQLKIRYVFKTATLIIDATKADRSVTSSSYELSALLDGTTGGPRGANPAAVYAAAYRQIAIQTLDTIRGYLAPFSKRNKETACASFHQYSPKVADLVAYFQYVQRTLQSFKAD